jgi:hypothetical protein
MLPRLRPLFLRDRIRIGEYLCAVGRPAFFTAVSAALSCGSPPSPIFDAARDATIPPGVALVDSRAATRAGLGMTAEWAFVASDWAAYSRWVSPRLEARGFVRTDAGSGQLSFTRSILGDFYIVQISPEEERAGPVVVRVSYLAHPD